MEREEAAAKRGAKLAAEMTLAWTGELDDAKEEYERRQGELSVAKEAVRAGRAERDRARRELLDSVLKARAAGLTYRAIGEVLGVTPQRVLGMIDRARGRGS